MRHIGTLIITFICFYSSDLRSQSKFDSLVSKTWKFDSYIKKGKLINIESENLKYTLKFEKKRRFYGLATYNYYGRYKLSRKNEIFIKRINVRKSAAPNATNSEEFEWRLKYARDLGYGNPIYFKVKSGELILYVKEDYTMIFKAID